MIRVVISGYLGKMGQVLGYQIENKDNMELVAGIDKNISSYKGETKVYENIARF